MKRTIRLTESDLRHIISESVRDMKASKEHKPQQSRVIPLLHTNLTSWAGDITIRRGLIAHMLFLSTKIINRNVDIVIVTKKR